MVFFMENYNYYSKNIKKLEIIINTPVIVMLEFNKNVILNEMKNLFLILTLFNT